MMVTRWLRSRCTLLAGASLIGLGGCVAAGTADTSEEQPQASKPLGGAPETYIGPTGTRFRLVGKANVQTLGPGVGPHQYAQDARDVDDPEKMPSTLEELAEALRPVTLVGGTW